MALVNRRRLGFLAGLLLAAASLAHAQSPAPLRVVGVLGNTSGLSALPFPYAYYTGIAADAHARLYFAGAAAGVAVSDQEGNCLALLTLPGGGGLISTSQMVRAGDYVCFVATRANPFQSALFRMDTRPEQPELLRAEQVASGPGQWVLSPTLDAAGRVVVGSSQVDLKKYTVTAYAPAIGQATPLFSFDLPAKASWPWRHLVQVEPDGSFDVIHAGGENVSGRFDAHGQRLGDVVEGQIVDGLRYQFGYNGGLRRVDLQGHDAPGDCGSEMPETRMAQQLVRLGDRYFFAGRGGAVVAKWNGTNFVYTRRLGAVHIEDLASAGEVLLAAAFTSYGNWDVMHPLELPKNLPNGQLLTSGRPFYGQAVATLAPAPGGLVAVYRDAQGWSVGFRGPAHLEYDLPLPQLQQAGQAAALGADLLLADPPAGTIWRRPLLDKQAPLQAWRTDLPGVTAVAVGGDAVFVSYAEATAGGTAAAATRVARLSPDGQQFAWVSPQTYRGVRRLAATPDRVYVCDPAGAVVDQLDAATGALQARLGVSGQPGAALDHLVQPWAVAADANGVYIADNGAGRIVVATTSAWRPQIARLTGEERGPVVAVRLPVKPPAAGRMSVNVYDRNDLTVRQLACGVDSTAPVNWDGRDMYGAWAAPGVYRYHGLMTPKLALRYVTSLTQSGVPPYRTADGKGSWGGVWGNVMSVCTVTGAPDSDILVLWASEEGEGGLIRMSQDGEVRWKSHLDWWFKALQMALACDGESVYILGASAMGAPQGQTDYGGEYRRPLLWRVDVATGAKRLYGRDTGPQPMFGEYLKGGRIATGIAYHDGRLYLTAPAQNRVFVADAATGQELAAWPVDQASGVTFDAAGRLLVGSGEKIVSLGPEGQVTEVASASGLVWGLAAAPGGGCAASVGAPRQQVVYFDAAGRETGARGQRGGRPLCGKLVPDSFLEPVGLCVTGGGRLFVAEDSAPRRFTRWSATGQWERQWHGPYYLSGMFGIDEENPDYVYGDTHGSLIRYHLDYQTGQWEVDSYWTGVYQPTDTTNEQGLAPPKWWPRIRHHNGQLWWCSSSAGIVELKPDGFRPVAAVWGGWVEKQADGNYRAIGAKQNTGLKGTWSDRNGDGRAQPEEWRVTASPAYPLAAPGPQQAWGSYFDDDYNCYLSDWSDRAEGGVWKLPVEWQGDVPTYDWAHAQHVGQARDHGLQHGAAGARTSFAWGEAVFAFNGGYNAAGLPGVGHGRDWEFAQVTKYDQMTGRPLWHCGERAAGFAAPGQMYCPTGAAGVIGEYLFWTDENSLVHAWDLQHGLYVGTVLEDTMRNPTPNPYTVWVELFNTRVFRHPKDGKVYLLAASDAIHVYELTGADQKPVRFSGEFMLTPEALAAAQAQVAAATVSGPPTLRLPRATGPVPITGDFAPFAAAPSVDLPYTEQESATARLLYDDQNLYLACDVRDPSPWRNAGDSISTLFKTGDEISLWVGPTAGDRPAGVGDVRVLLAPMQGRNVAVAFRAKVATGAAPVPFRSPAGQVVLDKVELLADVKIVIVPTATGYRLEAAIPRAELGLGPEVQQFSLDLSVNFSDASGQRNTARIHWGRGGGAEVYDLPSEARLEPATWGVGVLAGR
jgi:hypothetical protein